jgi:hypothetical protein
MGVVVVHCNEKSLLAARFPSNLFDDAIIWLLKLRLNAQYSPLWDKEGCPSDSEDGVFLRRPKEVLPRQSALRLTDTPSQGEGELEKA